MAHPRFALVIGGNRVGSPGSTWPYGDHVVGEPAADGSWFAWRLLGGNNRELGRSAVVHPSATACRDAAARLRDRSSDLASVLATDARQGRWRWRVDDRDGTVAVSSRLYLRQRECTYNLAQFTAGAAGAVLWGTDDDGGEPVPSADPQTPEPRVVLDLTGLDPTGPALTGVVPPRRVPPTSSTRALAPVVALPAPALSLTTRARQDAVLVRRRHRLPAIYPVIRARSS
jgi:hypothetical protein